MQREAAEALFVSPAGMKATVQARPLRPRPSHWTEEELRETRTHKGLTQAILMTLQRSQSAADRGNKVITRPQLSFFAKTPPSHLFVLLLVSSPLFSLRFFFPTTLNLQICFFSSQSRRGKTQLGPSLFQREKQFISLYWLCFAQGCLISVC